MKAIYLILFLTISVTVIGQNYYWVSFTDKNDTEFDPYSYFDDKAIERRVQNNISIYDISDYPLNSNYVTQVSELSEEYIGETRWFNAVAVFADDESIVKIKSLDFVKEVNQIVSDPIYCEYENETQFKQQFEQAYKYGIQPQLTVMGGEEFIKNSIDGKGIRVAVFDGGFPDVDTHDAFAHLRENNQIKLTYNFPKKQEDVYGWNSHGTSVLSCIAGMDRNGNKMGLATGSEFILARTEINSEPAKEEVYWMMALEWADKNGADVINSSLGYGADRHNPSDMDGKTCLVSRAANTAASKGILVCNAMGNEGDQNSWKTLGAPADADSILSIGGVEQNSGYHINFSSYGPTADGRMKPNVSAWGKANVAEPDNKFGTAYGTSFASPLVAGFVACAWQTKKDLTAMQLKTEVEKSGNMYPYYDYAVGYGVPQAGYFTDSEKDSPEKIFELVEGENEIIIRVANRSLYEKVLVLYHIENENDQLEYYAQNEFWMSSGDEITIDKLSLAGNKVLRVYCKGYMEEFMLKDNIASTDDDKRYRDYIDTDHQYNIYSKDVKRDKPSKFGVNSKYYIMPYVEFGLITPPDNGNLDFIYGKSRTFTYGLRYINNVSKWYRIGVNLDYSSSKYFININPVINYVDSFEGQTKINALNLELFQRFRLVPGTMTGFGIYLDLGVYGSLVTKFSDINTTEYNTGVITESVYVRQTYNKWNWGVKASFGKGILSVYGKYRMTDIFDGGLTISRLPKLEAGIDLALPLVMN